MRFTFLGVAALCVACESDILPQLEGPLDETGQVGTPSGGGGGGTDIDYTACNEPYGGDVTIGFGEPGPDVGGACRIQGSVRIGVNATEDEIDELDDVVEITGELSVTSVADGDVLGALSRITKVGSAVTVVSTGVTDLDFLGNLRDAGALVVRNNPQLTDIDGISDVRVLRGSLHLETLPATALTMDQLTQADTVHIGPTGLTSIALTALPTTGLFKLEFNAGLTSARFPALNSVSRDLFVRNNPALETLDLSGLNQVGGAFFLCDVDQATVDEISGRVGKPAETACN